MKKLMSIFVLFLVAGICVYFFINKTEISNSVNNWKVYSDKNYGFEIQIPSGWTGEHSVNDKGVTIYQFASERDPNTIIGINVPLKSDFKPKTSVIPDNKMLNGYNAVHYNINEGSIEIYVLNNNGQTIAITLFYSQDTKDIVKQIISTFKYNSL